MHRQLAGSPALLRSSGGGGRASAMDSGPGASAATATQQGSPMLLPTAYSSLAPGGLGAAGAHDLLASLTTTQGVLQQQGALLSPGSTLAAGGMAQRESDRGPLSVTSSMDSDDFSSIMTRLLSDITQSLASAGPPAQAPTHHPGASAAQPTAARGMGGGAPGNAAPAAPGISTGSSSGPLTISSGPASSLSSGFGG